MKFSIERVRYGARIAGNGMAPVVRNGFRNRVFSMSEKYYILKAKQFNRGLFAVLRKQVR